MKKPKPKTKEAVGLEDDGVTKPDDGETSEDEGPAFDIETFAKMPEDVFMYLFDSAVDAVFGKQPGSRGK